MKFRSNRISLQERTIIFLSIFHFYFLLNAIMFTPRSTAELSEQAVVSVEPNLSIRLYFRSAELLLRQARIYQLENDLERAYVQYMKYTK